MQNVVGGGAVQVVRKLGAVGVGEGVDDDVHAIQPAALLRVGEEQLGMA